MIPDTACDFSVIVPCWDRYEQTVNTLTCLVSNTSWLRGELILVDNGSTVPAYNQMLYRFALSVPRFHIIRNRENLGVARAWNQGLRVAEGNVIIVTANDILLPEGWLDELLSLLSIRDVGCAALCVDKPNILDHCTVRLESPDGTVGRESAGNVGGPTAFTRDLHRKLGYFDEGLCGLYGEVDSEWGSRVHCVGLKNVYSERLLARHIGKETPYNTDGADRDRKKAQMRERAVKIGSGELDVYVGCHLDKLEAV